MLENLYSYLALSILLGAIAYLLFRLRRVTTTLREKESLVQAIAENSLLLLSLKDLHGRYLFVNAQYQTRLQRPSEQILGKTDAELFSPEVAETVRAKEQQVQQTGTPLEYEEEIAVEQEVRTSHTVKFPIRDAEGKLCGVGSVAMDVSARKQMEEALRRSEAQFHRLAANFPGGMIFQYLLRPDGSTAISYISPSCRDLFEADSEEIQRGAVLERLIHPEDRAALEQSIARSAQTLSPWNWEGRYILRSGTLKWIQAASRPEKQANGDILWDGLMMDITERKQMETAMRESQARYELAVEGSHDGLWDIDLRTNEIYLSLRLKELTGYADQGQKDTSDLTEAAEILVHPDDEPLRQQAMQDHLERKKPYDFECRLRMKSGEYRWFHIRGQAQWDAQGNAVRIAGATRDIHERKLNEERLRQSANILAASITQIMSSLTEVLTSSSNTASAITQTASTVEEVKQTAYVAGQKAQTVSSTTQQTMHVAQLGEHAVETAITGLHGIRGQMESIAHSVITLGEQSQAIGEIITNVSELAEQSNLLAVNAAIEAAKAGEQGRGFTAVAQEIRSLATRSKTATVQVRTILQDIQKAANVAVLVTEQGTKAVETGVQQSIEANQSIRTLSQGVTDAAQAVTQIAASSQQQVVGMDQVAMAMENIKQATRQNVEGMRQIEQAVQQLQGVGQTLQGLLEQDTSRPSPIALRGAA